MLNRRSGLLAALVVVGACGFGAFAAAATHDGGEAEVLAVQLGESSIAASQPVDDAPRLLPRVPVKDGPKPSAFTRPRRATDALVAEMPVLAKNVRRIATTRTMGTDHAVYIGNDSREQTCVVLQEGSLGRGGGGCSPARNPFLGSTVLWSSSHFNEDPQKLVLFGVVTDRVASVSLAFDHGEATAVPLSEDGGFIHVVAKPTIAPTDVPDAIITFDSKGREIERMDLGITFGP